jgi:ribA/ribD-fused uncharacterized protein
MITQFNEKYEFLSNFYPCEIEFEGILYPTSEHAYQAAKTTDPEIKRYIAEMPTPGATKKFAKKIKIVENWDQIKFGIMEKIVRLKFSREPFRTMLLETGNQDLVEGNYWHDVYWGQCNCAKHHGQGENNLGKILMKIRSEMRVQ